MIHHVCNNGAIFYKYGTVLSWFASRSDAGFTGSINAEIIPSHTWAEGICPKWNYKVLPDKNSGPFLLRSYTICRLSLIMSPFKEMLRYP